MLYKKSVFSLSKRTILGGKLRQYAGAGPGFIVGGRAKYNFFKKEKCSKGNIGCWGGGKGGSPLRPR